MSDKEIYYDVKDYVGTITINRPKSLNAFTGDNIAEMQRLLDVATADFVYRRARTMGIGTELAP